MDNVNENSYKMDKNASADQPVYIKENLEKTLERIAVAARAAGRSPDEVMLVPAVKYASAQQIEYLCRTAGVKRIGENRVQQLLDHLQNADLGQVEVHFIGTLQTNKVKYIIDKVSMIHSVDSEKLACEIDKQAKKHGIVMDVLLEINCGEEQSKSGVLPDEAEALCLKISRFENLRLKGFMTMAPKCDKKEDYIKYFSQTYAQVIDIWTKKMHNIDSPIISMGMSDSYEQAIACGATIVRVGRSLFAHEQDTQN